MPWITPSSVSTGDVLTASRWNQDIVSNAAELAPFMSAWTSWTPSSRSGFTVGNGTEVAKYLKVGKMVCVVYNFTLGSTSSVSGDIQVALPVSQASSPSDVTITARMTDTGANNYGAVAYLTSGIAYVRALNASGTYLSQSFASNTVPFTWGSTDTFGFAGVYEAA